MITKLKYFLIKYFPAVIFFIIKNYFGLDFNDFNPFTSETKEFFNGNSGDKDQTRIPISSILNPDTSGEEGEGSNRENNPQDSSINPEEVKEVEGGVVVSGETLE